MITRVMLSEQIKEVLLDRILTGKYQPGDRLVESQIAKDMGVSQSPVREALRDLVAMRFVEVLPHKGARVRRVEPNEIFEIYPVRAALEELAGRLAAPNLKGNVGQLEEAVVGMRHAARTNDLQAIVAKDVEFHRIIIRAAGNRILADAWESLMIEARTFVTAVNMMISDIGIERIADMHRAIINALARGDPRRSGAAMREHVESFGTVMRRVYKDGAENRRPVDAGAQRDDAVPRNPKDRDRHLRGLGAGGQDAGNL